MTFWNFVHAHAEGCAWFAIVITSIIGWTIVSCMEHRNK